MEHVRTLDVQIIDLADDIAYAVHDLEDALSLSYFTIDEILYEMKQDIDGYKKEECEAAAEQMSEIVNNSRRIAKESNSYHTLQEYSQVFIKTLASQLTNYFTQNIVLGTVTKEDAQIHGTKEGQRELRLGDRLGRGDSGALCRILSKKIFKGVTRLPNVALYEERGAQIITDLFNMYADKDLNKDGQLLPPDYRPDCSKRNLKKEFARAAADYISGMMDTFAIDTYKKIFGTSFSAICIGKK